jgi:hypothetical protein
MKRKCKIVGLPDKLPTANQGMSVANGNQNPAIPPTFREFPSVDSKPEIKVNRSLKPVKRKDANLEAEKGETVVTHLSGEGITEFYNIGGKRHYDGGTPLNLPDNSFIFSRDRSMKIKDKEILKEFGKNVGKKGKKSFTPAELSKPYNINKYRQVLADPTSDKIMRESAELMIENYNLKLGKLALVQESQKSFPSGIPQVSLPYLESIGISPEDIVPPQEPQQQQLPMARYGGSPNSKAIQRMEPSNVSYNGLRKHQTPPGETLTSVPSLNPLKTQGYQNWYQGQSQPQVGITGSPSMFDVAYNPGKKLNTNWANFIPGAIATATALGHQGVSKEDIANVNMYSDPTRTSQGYTGTNLGVAYPPAGFGPGIISKKGGEPFKHGGEQVRFNPASSLYEIISLGGQVIGTMNPPQSMNDDLTKYAEEGEVKEERKKWDLNDLENGLEDPQFTSTAKEGDLVKIDGEWHTVISSEGKAGVEFNTSTDPVAKSDEELEAYLNTQSDNTEVDDTEVDNTEVDDTKVDDTEGGGVDVEGGSNEQTLDEKALEVLERFENDEYTDEDIDWLKEHQDELVNVYDNKDDTDLQNEQDALKQYEHIGDPTEYNSLYTDFSDPYKTAIGGNRMAGLLARRSGIPPSLRKDLRLQTPTILNPMGARMGELSQQKNIYDALTLGGRDAMTFGSKLASTPSNVIPEYARMNLQNITGIGNQNIEALNEQAGWEAQARNNFARDVERGRAADNRQMLGFLAQDRNLVGQAQADVMNRAYGNIQSDQYNLTGDMRNPIAFDPRYVTQLAAGKSNEDVGKNRLSSAMEYYKSLSPDAKKTTSVKDIYTMMYDPKAVASQTMQHAAPNYAPYAPVVHPGMIPPST